jgi:hypothetical protein
MGVDSVAVISEERGLGEEWIELIKETVDPQHLRPASPSIAHSTEEHHFGFERTFLPS